MRRATRLQGWAGVRRSLPMFMHGTGFFIVLSPMGRSVHGTSNHRTTVVGAPPPGVGFWVQPRLPYPRFGSKKAQHTSLILSKYASFRLSGLGPPVHDGRWLLRPEAYRHSPSPGRPPPLLGEVSRPGSSSCRRCTAHSLLSAWRTVPKIALRTPVENEPLACRDLQPPIPPISGMRSADSGG